MLEPLLLPNKIQFTRGDRPHEGVLVVEPCTQGYGTTLGNALRRVLLSSLPGAAVIAVRIKGVDHEFSTAPHIKEDILEIILNLKLLRAKVFSDEPIKLSLSVKEARAITAADFSKDALVEIVNPDLHIATLTESSGSFDMEVWIGKGRGYRPTEERLKEKLELGTIAVDALYSPVVNVSYKVEATRVGDKTDYDKLVLKIETDGSLDPIDAVNQGVGILNDYVNVLKDVSYTEAA